MFLSFHSNLYAQFDIVVKNRDGSIDGSMIEEGSIPYSRISVPEQEEGDVLFLMVTQMGEMESGNLTQYPVSILSVTGM